MDVKGAVTGEDWMGLKPASVQTFNWSKLGMLSAHLSPCRETIWTRAPNRFSTIAEYHVIINTHQENDCVLRSSSECQFGPTLSCYFYAILAQVGLTSQSRLMYPFNADCSWRRYSCWHCRHHPGSTLTHCVHCRRWRVYSDHVCRVTAYRLLLFSLCFTAC